MRTADELRAMSAEEMKRLSERLESRPLSEILRWAWERFGARAAIGTSFQGAGIVILHHAYREGLPLPAFTLDTGFLFPETLELKAKLESRLGLQIESIHPDQTPDEQDAEMGPALWSHKPDLCCTLRKVMPLQRKLADLDVWITGVRRHQAATRAGVQVLERYRFDVLRDGVVFKLNPLAGWSRDQVWDYIREHDLPYNALRDRGYGSIGCHHCTRALDKGEDSRAGRWTGFEKTECGIHTFLGENI